MDQNKTASVILLTVFLVVAPEVAFAQIYWFDTGRTFEVYAYGSGNFLATIFNGVAMITSGGLVHSLVKIGLILMLLYGVMISMSNFIGAGGMAKAGGGEVYKGEGFTTIISVALTALVAVGLFLSPRATVAIIDRVDPSQSQVVGNVPFPSAFIPHMMSTIGDGIGKEFETVFALPDALQFRNGGIALGAKYTDALMNIYPPNSSSTEMPSDAFLITASLREYYIKCVFPNYASLDGTAGVKTASMDDMTTTGDLMTHLKSSLYRTPHVVISSPNDTGWATCAVAIDEIDAKWNTYIVPWRKDIEIKLSGNAGLSSLSGAGNPLNLGTGALTTSVTNRYFANSSVHSNTILKTIAAANLLRDSMDTYLAYMGSPTSTAITASRRSTTAGWLTAAKFFNTIVHTTRAIVEGLIYGLSVLLPLFFIFGGLSAVLFYGKIALWLQLWVPIYVIINLYADQEVTRVMDNIFITANAKSPSLKTMDLIADQLELTLGYVGSLAPVVPAIAWGLVSGGAYAMQAAIQAVGGGAAPATASSTGAQVVGMGNLTMGNMSMGNSNIGASTIASSQAGHMPQLMSGMTTAKTLQGMIPQFGGVEGLIVAGGGAGVVKGTTDIGNTAGQLAGADGMNGVYKIAQATGKGDTGGKVKAGETRAGLTGEAVGEAITGNMVDGQVVQAVKTVGQTGAIAHTGTKQAAEGEALNQMKSTYSASALFEMGMATGANMYDREQSAAFYKGLTQADGINQAVTKENVSAMNAKLDSLGLKTANVGETVNLKFANGQISSSKITGKGSSKVTDNSDKLLDGKSAVHDNSHKFLAGTSSVLDNSHTYTAGDKIDTRNMQQTGNVNISSQINRNERPEGTYNYDGRGNLVNAQTSFVHAATTADSVKGLVQKTYDPKTGLEVRSESKAGSVEHEDINKVSKDGGVEYKGMVSAGARTSLEIIGFSKETAQDITGVGGGVLKTVTELAGTFRMVDLAMKGSAAKAAGTAATGTGTVGSYNAGRAFGPP